MTSELKSSLNFSVEKHILPYVLDYFFLHTFGSKMVVRSLTLSYSFMNLGHYLDNIKLKF